MDDTKYNSLLVAHVAEFLYDTYGQGKEWPPDMSMGLGVMQAVAGRLRREDFADFVQCLVDARARSHWLLPDTLLTRLSGPIGKRFPGTPPAGIGQAARLLSAVAESLPESDFETLVDATTAGLDIMQDVERRLKAKEPVRA
ncbi:hypothetical protein ACFCYC_42495 [Streptomyces sp. NPDC056402]|uniref:hypothetical protein n=1 Tax=Streptomyces sp. NPDC056402 TaxID=3345810 RepID=UPI0035DC15D0